jgi:hypothetical protein
MRKRSFFLAVAVGLLACSVGPMDARAGTVMVNEDEGTLSVSMTSNGAGEVTTVYSNVLLTTINGALIPTGSIASTFDTAM